MNLDLTHRRYVLGLDIGGTKILAGLSDLAGNLLIKREFATDHGPGHAIVDQVVDLAKRLPLCIGLQPVDLVGAVIGVPATVIPQSGLLALSPNLTLPDSEPLANLLARRLNCPVDVENDANLAAYGEAIAGRGLGRGSLALVTFGTGVGMGIVVNGEIMRGAFGRAGEISLLPLGGDLGPDVARLGSGQFEEVVGSSGIRQRYGETETTVREIFDRAALGEEAAVKAIEETARVAALGLASVQALLDPEILALGGSIGAREEFAIAVRRHLATALPFPVAVEIGLLGREAGLYGALFAAVRREKARLTVAG